MHRHRPLVFLLVAPVFASLGGACIYERTAFAAESNLALEGAAPPQKLGLTMATYALGSPAGCGAAVSPGLRFALGEHAALSLDLGYAVLSAPPTTQDRWWIMPAVAAVLRAELVRFDIGVGLGLGASSGYGSFTDYTRGPFAPRWAFQLVPTARVHLMAAAPLGRDLDVYLRAEAATLVLSGTDLGIRNGDANPSMADTTWLDVGAGVQVRLM
jgi:hypothetical protein